MKHLFISFSLVFSLSLSLSHPPCKQQTCLLPGQPVNLQDHRFLLNTARPRTRVLTHFDTRTTQRALLARKTFAWRRHKHQATRHSIDAQEADAGYRLPDKLLAVPAKKTYANINDELPQSFIFIRDVFIILDRLFPVPYATEDPGRIMVDCSVLFRRRLQHFQILPKHREQIIAKRQYE